MTSRDFPNEIIDESSKRNELRRPNTLADGLRGFSTARQEATPRRWPPNNILYGQDTAQLDLTKLANFGRNSKMASPDDGDQSSEMRQSLRLEFGSASPSPGATPSSIKQPSPSNSILADLGHTAQIERLRSRGIERTTGKLQISPEESFEFTSEDLKDLGEMGRGNYGFVNKMIHEKSGTIMAVKRIRSTVEERDQKQLLMDLDVVMRSNDCPYIVQFYGALFKEGDCWICMELMDISLDKFYKFVYSELHEFIPEDILGKITVATVKALNYLKEKLKIIHRDVKPSNILLDRKGNIKLCDFGISGHLVDSIAKSRDAGCRPYMAPERIDPKASSRGYDVRSDVWSLGITLMELATGKFPYPKWQSVFDQLQQVVQGSAPRLPSDSTFSVECINFINTCLTKEDKQRPKYNKLLEDPFIKRYEEVEIDVASYVCRIHDLILQSSPSPSSCEHPLS
ncbi:Dual specificity mitogen-activated protein kinase kinase 4 [Biomphalaria glabrata]|uniref:mitogen-activated protein kinase kinase n=2 Tax=Biomphalaria TaxID=6525 RepID=A0A9W2ZRG5_BIOGL|nr:dual specificity mitogen-activated protein kinase kinase 4-like isoform X1 [Biomphalaria glabrata]KAI8764769.1 dual specificity mitogen-activated protein kinase kinase 4 isoform X1 [Biomphalaria glabrata]